MLRHVNSYLSSLNAPFSLKPPLPSGRHIADAVHLVSSRLGLPPSSLEDDLPLLLRFFSCPFKLTKSALKAPGTPHAWPSFVAALHFLVELASVHDRMSSSPHPFAQDNNLVAYAVDSYSEFIVGNDDAVQALDDSYLAIARGQVDAAEAAVRQLEGEVEAKEAAAKEALNGPTPRERLARERDELAGDVAKFRRVVERFSEMVVKLEEGIEAKRKEVEAKEVELRRMSEENEELRKRGAGQTLDAEGVERMRKEVNSLERDIAETKASRKSLEEKIEELDVAIGRKLKELVSLEDRCNEAIRKLKLHNEFQYVLNVEGSSPLDVLGASYKTVLKPALKALAEDTKKSHVEKIELTIALQQQLQEQAAILKEKKERAFALQAKINSATADSNSIKKEIDDYSSLCESEIKTMLDEVETRMRKLEMVENEAREFLKNSELKLQEEIKMSDESIQMCAQELLVLVDLISNYKEDMESTISGMKSELRATINAIAEAHQDALSSRLSSISTDASHWNVKRVRLSSEDL